ncbi:MAG: hypothetical protein MPN21_24225 [Thermoanaerobaculia bacterium]|nr:hypothetical protein [Thermoanaerobaculia bacterium]
MTRRTERTLTISLLILILAVGIILVFHSRGHRAAFASQEDRLEGFLAGKIDAACKTPERQHLEKLRRCEEVVDQVMADSAKLTGWIDDLWQREEDLRGRVEAQLGDVIDQQETTRESLGKLVDSTQQSSERLETLAQTADQHRGFLESLGASVRVPPCIGAEGEACPEETLGSLTASLRADLVHLQSDLAEHDDGMDAKLTEDFEQRQAEGATAEERWRQTTTELESRLLELEVALAEREQLREVIRGGLTPRPRIVATNGETITLEAAPPMEGYRCDKLQLVAQLISMKETENGAKATLVAVDAPICQGLKGMYQCGRLGGQNNSLTLWAMYRDVFDDAGRRTCRADLTMPRPVLDHLGKVGIRQQSLRLKIGVHTEVESDLLGIS